MAIKKRGFESPIVKFSDGYLASVTQAINRLRLSPIKNWSWISQCVELPEGTRLRMTYSGAEHCGTGAGGKWKVANQYYITSSGAASAVART